MIIKEKIIASEKESVEKLQELLNQYKDKLVVVVGTSCSGKTTFLKNIKNAHDMDELIFPLLTKEEHDYVCQDPRTPEIWETMTKWVKEKVKLKKGEPIFGTVRLDSDIVIHIKVEDDLLKERTEKRNAKFENIKNMQKDIEDDIENSNAEVIEFLIKK